jgi:outer membrane biosynthesis protein TonB
MSSAPTHDQQPVKAKIEEVSDQLSGLARDLAEIDQVLATLSEQRTKYQLLENLCGSLDELVEIDGAALFWGQQPQGLSPAEQIQNARSRISDFNRELQQVQNRRLALVEGIKEGQEVIDILEDDLLERQIAQEERDAEWYIERDLDERAERAIVMPWAHRGEDDRRFRKTLAASLLACLFLGLVIPLIDVPLIQREQEYEVPERFAELIREEPRPLPEVEPEPVQPEIEEPEIEPEEEPVVAEEETPVEAPVVDEEAPVVAEETAPVEEAPPASGILAFRETFSNLAAGRPSTQLGSDAQISSAGEDAIGLPERSMVTTQEPGSSGGINLSSLSRDVGGGGGSGGQIGGVAVTRVASSIGGNGTSNRPLAGTAVAGRTDEEIQIVFDRYKASLYRLYNRELRADPTLRGQIVLRLTIEPDGSVSFCEVQASDMGAPALEQQVVSRVLTLDFGAKEDVPALTILYPIDFLPAA